MEIDNYHIICPYCKCECGDYSDFQDYDEDESKMELECDGCNKKFMAEKIVTIDYRTYADCKLNGEEHEKGKYQCKKCDVYNVEIGERR